LNKFFARIETVPVYIDFIGKYFCLKQTVKPVAFSDNSEVIPGSGRKMDFIWEKVAFLFGERRANAVSDRNSTYFL
jgi:hypothetical protein